MDLKKATELVKSELNQSRYEHTLRVIETSKKLAERFSVSFEKVGLAAAFHDYAKNWSTEKLKTYIQRNLSDELLDYHVELWHGPVAAHVLEKKYKVTDEDVLLAIRHHTTGRANMGKVEMIVYLADYIEPGRNFPGVEDVRLASEKSLHYACWLAAKKTLHFLIEKNSIVHPDSFCAYNDLTKLVKMEGFIDE